MQVCCFSTTTPLFTQGVMPRLLCETSFQKINYPRHSTDLAPSDYFLFPNIKKDLRGKSFYDDEELKAAINAHFLDKNEKYF